MEDPKKPSPTAIDWRRVVSTACLKCDWTSLAEAALGSTQLAGMIGDAFRIIGQSIEHEIGQAEAAHLRDEPPPIPEVKCAAEPAPTVLIEPEVAEAAALLGIEVDADA